MSENKAKKCPKCGGEMEKGARITSAARGWIPQAVTLAKEGDFYGDKIIPFYCRKCCYIELYMACMLSMLLRKLNIGSIWKKLCRSS